MHDPSDEELRSLPRLDVDSDVAERIRVRAHRVLSLAQPATKRLGVVRRLHRRLEPVLVGAVAASYLFWAISVVVP